MAKLIGVAILVFIAWLTWQSVWGAISSGMIGKILITNIPMAIFCFAIGLLSIKRESKKAGKRIIVCMIVAQNIAALTYWDNIILRDGGVIITDVVITGILVSIIFAIPGIIANSKA